MKFPREYFMGCSLDAPVIGADYVPSHSLKSAAKEKRPMRSHPRLTREQSSALRRLSAELCISFQKAILLFRAGKISV